MEDTVHLVDGFPMPVCQYARASGSRCFRGEAGFSYCAANTHGAQGMRNTMALKGMCWSVLCPVGIRRDHLWLCPCRRECGRTRCAAGDGRRPARVVNRGQRLYPAQPKARIGTTRHGFANAFTEKHAGFEAKGVRQSTDVKQALGGDGHRAIDRTLSYRLGQGPRHLAFGQPLYP